MGARKLKGVMRRRRQRVTQKYRSEGHTELSTSGASQKLPPRRALHGSMGAAQLGGWVGKGQGGILSAALFVNRTAECCPALYNCAAATTCRRPLAVGRLHRPRRPPPAARQAAHSHPISRDSCCTAGSGEQTPPHQPQLRLQRPNPCPPLRRAVSQEPRLCRALPRAAYSGRRAGNGGLCHKRCRSMLEHISSG